MNHSDVWVCLITIKTDEGHISHLIEKPSLTVGRTREVDVPVIDPSVSRHHLTVTVEPQVIWIQDEKSANGTFLNGRRVPAGERFMVHEGDIVRIGSLNDEFHFFAIPKPFQMMDRSSQNESLANSMAEVSTQIRQQAVQKAELELNQLRQTAQQEIKHLRSSTDRELQIAKREAERELQGARLKAEQIQMQAQKEAESLRVQLNSERLAARQELEVEVANSRQQSMLSIAEEVHQARKEASLVVTEAQKQVQRDYEEAGQRATVRMSEAESMSTKLIEEANLKAHAILTEARTEAGRVRQSANEEARGTQQEAMRKSTSTMTEMREKYQRELEEKRAELLAQAQKAASVEMERIAQEQAKKIDDAKKLEKALEEKNARSTSEMEALKSQRAALEEKLKTLGPDLEAARKLLSQVEDLESRKSQAEQDWTDFSHKLENGRGAIEAELNELRNQGLVDLEARKSAQTNELAKERLKAIADFKAHVQSEEERFESLKKLRCVELSQKLGERLIPKLEAWLQSPAEARTQFGPEIETAVKQVMLKDGATIQAAQVAAKTELVEERKGRATKIALLGAVAAAAIIYFNWDRIYPMLERSQGDSYAKEMLERRRIESIFAPDQDDKYRDTYTDNILYYKGYYNKKSSSKAVDKWTLRLNDLKLLKPMGLSEEDIVSFITKETTLVRRLGILRNNIDSQFKDAGITAMRNAEGDSVKELKTVLKGDANYKKIRQLESDFIKAYEE